MDIRPVRLRKRYDFSWSKMFRTKKTIYVDMDDVLCETAQALLGIAAREFGKTIPYDQLNTFEVGGAFGLEMREIEELFRMAHHPEEMLAMAPISEAITVLADWARSGHEIAIVTGRPPATYDVSRARLRPPAPPRPASCLRR